MEKKVGKSKYEHFNERNPFSLKISILYYSGYVWDKIENFETKLCSIKIVASAQFCANLRHKVVITGDVTMERNLNWNLCENL